jgi:hypothetical protein
MNMEGVGDGLANHYLGEFTVAGELTEGGMKEGRNE